MVRVSADAELAARLHAHGLRMTPQRGAVLAAVQDLEHATPEQISDRLTDIDVTTVYRTLELLEDLGLVRHAHLGHGAPSFRPADDDHVHVVCHRCGRVTDAPAELIAQVADQLRAERGFIVDRSHFTVFGLCRECAQPDRARHHPAATQGTETTSNRRPARPREQSNAAKR